MYPSMRCGCDGVAVPLELGVDAWVERVEDDHGPFAARVQVGEQVLEQLEALGVVVRRYGRVLLDAGNDGGRPCLHFLYVLRGRGPDLAR